MLLLLVGGLYSVIVLATMFPFKGAIRVAIVGWICVAFSVCVFAAPLSIVVYIYTHFSKMILITFFMCVIFFYYKYI